MIISLSDQYYPISPEVRLNLLVWNAVDADAVSLIDCLHNSLKSFPHIDVVTVLEQEYYGYCQDGSDVIIMDKSIRFNIIDFLKEVTLVLEYDVTSYNSQELYFSPFAIPDKKWCLIDFPRKFALKLEYLRCQSFLL